MKKKIGILFDLDGTLLDTLEDLADAVNAALNHFGCPARTLQEIRSMVGDGVRHLITQALPGREDDPDVDAVLAWYIPYYQAHCQDKTKPYEGVQQALKTLQSRCPVAIVSNKPDKAVKTLCAQFFPGVHAQGQVDTCPRKPAPDMLHLTMRELGVETCVYVGDTEVDVLTAQNAGVPCVTVLWGFRDRQLLERSGAKHFCHTPDGLIESIETISSSL